MSRSSAVGRLRRHIAFGAAITAGLLAVQLVPTASSAGTAAVTSQPCSGFPPHDEGTCLTSTVTLGGRSYAADWYVPTGTPRAVMLLEHGFGRRCANLRATSRAIMARNVMVLCISADMTGGNPSLGNALGDALADGSLRQPHGSPLPAPIIVGGHSAGGHFASVVGARLAARGYPGLRGAILFDAVASGGFSANLQAISAGGTRPVLQVAARPALANLWNNSFGALRGLPNAYRGIQLRWSGTFAGLPYGSSCHTDVEGENTDLLGTVGSGCSPSRTQTARLREFSSAWAADLATGSRTAAYWCADGAKLSACGSRVRELADRRVPLAVPIR